ncbi:SGNH/GDSL hydrolase family protein [Rathayibacter sp. AY1A3]|uniref:SGNH/GDSL hydrolase family protein n=1 Tax=Rathayibacter sp. AY1A3 TaxID=2080521 RepID=UPI000CE77E78|nr:SGNH/GDSL hydrolase family protein [Rathayibacter sp. AY1A3]PPF34397.1 hypothetical protein C5C10_09350 [Rathayibacter sp. AY1A3]
MTDDFGQQKARRWRGAIGAGAGAIALLGSLFIAGPAHAAGTQSLLALGDSISRGASTCGSTSDCTTNNWATGQNSAVNSIAARLEASDSSTSVTSANYAKSGSLISGVNTRIDAAVAAGADPDVVTLLIGGNDLCGPYNSAKADGYTMTTAAGFASAATGVMSKIASEWPQATVLVGSLPNLAAEWNTVKTTPGAAAIWASADLCRTTRGVTADGTQLTGTAYTASVNAAAARAADYNTALASACAAASNDCIWDGGAVTRMTTPLSNISDVDYFHPSVTGQAKIAATTWSAWGLPLGGSTPTPTPGTDTTAPTVAITSPASGTTVGSSVTFVASSTDNVATTRVSFWSGSTKLGDAAKASDGSWRLTVSTSAYPAGTYSITARALDAAGNEGRSAAISIKR